MQAFLLILSLAIIVEALVQYCLLYTSTAWDALGGAFTIEECTNAEIDQIFTDLAAG